MKFHLLSSRPLKMSTHRTQQERIWTPSTDSAHILRPRQIRRLPRRQWLQTIGTIGVASAAGLATSACTEEDLKELGRLIVATIVRYAVDKLAYALNEEVGGLIDLYNEGEEPASGEIDMQLVSSKSIADEGTGQYSVDPYSVATYKWSGLHSDYPADDYYAKSLSGTDQGETSNFSIGP